MLSRNAIKCAAQAVGFDCCGIVRAAHLNTREERFRGWLDAGCHASMHYLERNIDKRFDARKLVEGAHTVVVCAVSYKNSVSQGYPPEHRTKVASYGCNPDYHTTIKGMLKALLAALQRDHPELRGRAFVDSAPLAEKSLAVEAGLGWIGRNSLLITPQYGSFIHLGELVLNDTCESYDTPFVGERCGNCHSCLDHCPTAAIRSDRTIDARRCIACQTIEQDPDETIDLDGWIFGCDSCQHHCPYNLRAPMHQQRAFDPLFDPRILTAEEWLKTDAVGFDTLCGKTPMVRASLERIQAIIQTKVK